MCLAKIFYFRAFFELSFIQNGTSVDNLSVCSSSFLICVVLISCDCLKMMVTFSYLYFHFQF